ncbi:alpha/beta fold hydrolase [Pseudohongiella sp.]|uniref:AB hydrolase-1 domain-containing protein n=1 Tax=marine sediment metagenome TaxID=412755 RepID=A0A0F9YKH0_9ZZZZ|nr:alpha/beta hydrolase [Pseudohongiella sp.]
MTTIPRRLVHRSLIIQILSGMLLTLLALNPALAQERRQAPEDLQATSINLEDVPYPYPVHTLELTLYGNDIRMAYMDARPQGRSNGKTVVLLHGMNWYAEYWGETMARLTAEGYRVVAPDQIGFGRSSKPIMPYSLHDHVANTHAVLDELGIEKAIILGHSMGGVMATRFAFSYPETTEKLVLVNPIALTDWRMGRGWTRLQDSYESRRDNRDYEAVRRNFERYFVTWDPRFERYININYGWTLSSEWPRLAKVLALNSQWLYQDPTVYDRPHIEAPTLFLSGAEDGASFREDAQQVVADIPDARLHLIEQAGHMPFFEKPAEFYPALLEFLSE